jgi:hypothetical protein
VTDVTGGHELPAKLSNPAIRGLTGAGYTPVEQFATVSERDVLRLHGVGPTAIVVLRAELAARGLSFAEPG